jgi:hypothetical protein
MGWRKPPGAVVVPRPTGWAKPLQRGRVRPGRRCRPPRARRQDAGLLLPARPALPRRRAANLRHQHERPQPRATALQRHCRTTGQPCRNPPWSARRCRMHGGSGFSPQAQRAAVRRVLEAQMRGYAAVMMAERHACLDDPAAPGSRPPSTVRAGPQVLPRQRISRDPWVTRRGEHRRSSTTPADRPVPAPRQCRGCRAGRAAGGAIVQSPGASGPQLG